MNDIAPTALPPAHQPPDLSRRPWVPVRSLAGRHRGRILHHLLALDLRSRYLRFGYPATDEQIERYAASLDFEHDEVFGIFNRKLALIGVAHLAYRPAATPPGHEHSGTTTAEFGVSVLPDARRHGYGARLFEHAALHARNRHVRTFIIHALSENTAMLRIARHAGAIVERNGSESEAWLTLPPDTFGSHLDAAFVDRAAELDYRWKQRSHRAEADHPSEDSRAPEDCR